MKQLTCEMCGSVDIIKQDAVFVCQTCGCKYSVEEAKKMMIEGTVEVTGTVKVDDSAKISNYYTLAENAYDASNLKEAENYCNKIIEIDPNNYRAWLLKGRSAGWQSTLANMRVEESVNCFNKAIDNAPEGKIEEVKKVASEEISKLSIALVEICCENYSNSGSVDDAATLKKKVKEVGFYGLLLLKKCGVIPKVLNASIASRINEAAVTAYHNRIKKDYLGSSGHPSREEWRRYMKCAAEAADLIQLAIRLSDDDSTADIVRYENKIFILQEVRSSRCYISDVNGDWYIAGSLDLEAVKKIDNLIMECHKKIKEIDPSYTIPDATPAPPQSQSGNGCYVATAVYGSYDCPQVWTLRRYRDNTLAQRWYGRMFIRTYYAISPTLVKWFGHTGWFKNMWKGKLDKIVERLQAQGVESTPYEDREW